MDARHPETPPPPPSSSSSLGPLVANPKLAECTLRDLFAAAAIMGHAMREPLTAADVVHAFDVADEALEARLDPEAALEGDGLDASTWPSATEIFKHNETPPPPAVREP